MIFYGRVDDAYGMVDDAYGMSIKLNCLYKVKEVSSSESADDTS